MNHPDEYVRYWGEVFTANNLFERFSIRFDTFLDAPERILQAVFYGRPMPLPEDQDYYRLLPRQERIRSLLEAEELADELGELIERQIEWQGRGTCLRDGALIEPLRHHRFANRPKQRSFFHSRVRI